MKNRTDFGLNRRTFLSTSGLGLLGASMSGVLCNVPSKGTDEAIAGTLQPDGWKNILQEAKKYPKIDAHNHIWEGSNAEQVDESCER